jgi:uncharacterized GH25 family protein
VLALWLSLAAGASAHDFWIEPASFRPTAGSSAELYLRAGEYFAGEPVPRMPGWVDRFVVATRSGIVPVPGREWADPAGAVRIADPGLAVVAFESAGSWSELDGAAFESYLHEEGLDAVLAMRAERGERSAPGREVFVRCAKALLDVEPHGTAVDPASHPAGEPLGLTFEIVPRLDPYRLREGERIPLELLHRGRPLAGALVTALLRDRPWVRLAARSDAAGRVSFRLPLPGAWLIRSVHMEASDAAPGGGEAADWRSYWSSLTFELAARDGRVE